MTHFVNPKEVEGDLVAVTWWILPGAAPTTASSASATSNTMRSGPGVLPQGLGRECDRHRRGRGGRRRSPPGRSSSSPVGCGAGTAFGGVKRRSQVPKIVDWYMDGKINIDDLITHTMPLDEINDAFDLMHEGKSIRSVVTF